MRRLLIRQFFSLFAQFKTTTKSHENYGFPVSIFQYGHIPQNNQKTILYWQTVWVDRYVLMLSVVLLTVAFAQDTNSINTKCCTVELTVAFAPDTYSINAKCCTVDGSIRTRYIQY